jgi:hypothetical protein
LKIFNFIIVAAVLCFVIYFYPGQDEKMENVFYYNWLSIGDTQNIYSDKYSRSRFDDSAGKTPDSDETISTEGYVCKYANHLRNNNSYITISIIPKSKIVVNKISEMSSRSVYNCDRYLLVEHFGCWKLYDPESFKEIGRGNWGNNGSTFYCSDEGFQMFDNVLKRFSRDGELQNNFHLFSGSDLNRHDVVYLNDYIVSAGYLTPGTFSGDGLPGILKPAGQLESFNLKKGACMPDPEENISPENSNLLAFLQEKPLIPVYLPDHVVQPFINTIAILNYDLKIYHVIEGEFVPLSASAGRNSQLYMIAMFDNETRLISFDIDGNLFFTSTIQNYVGKVSCPPVISTNGNIYVISQYAVIAFNNVGELLWMNYFHTPVRNEIYPLIYNDILTVTYDQNIIVYNPGGEVIVQYSGIETKINTPLLSVGSQRYVVGTDTGLFEVIIQ